MKNETPRKHLKNINSCQSYMAKATIQKKNIYCVSNVFRIFDRRMSKQTNFKYNKFKAIIKNESSHHNEYSKGTFKCEI